MPVLIVVVFHPLCFFLFHFVRVQFLYIELVCILCILHIYILKDSIHPLMYVAICNVVQNIRVVCLVHIFIRLFHLICGYIAIHLSIIPFTFSVSTFNVTCVYFNDCLCLHLNAKNKKIAQDWIWKFTQLICELCVLCVYVCVCVCVFRKTNVENNRLFNNGGKRTKERKEK